MKKLFKKDKGFTLVELIVVIAILAILAAVAIPAYSGYIKKANDAADLTQLDSIKTAAAFVYTEKQIAANPAADVTISAMDVTTNAAGQVQSVTIGSTTITSAELQNMLGGTSVELPTMKGSYVKGATWDGSKWTPKN